MKSQTNKEESIFSKLRQLLDFCKKCGIDEKCGFSYTPLSTKWELFEGLYHHLIVYPTGTVIVETWHDFGNEPEKSVELSNPSIEDIVNEWIKQSKGVNKIYESLGE